MITTIAVCWYALWLVGCGIYATAKEELAIRYMVACLIVAPLLPIVMLYACFMIVSDITVWRKP